MAETSQYTTWSDRAVTFFGISLQIISVIFVARFINDVGVRMLYPFIPQFSAGLGMTVVGFGWLLFIRSIAGVMGPIFGVLADRYGRRKIMAISLLFQAIGGAGLAFAWQWWAALPVIISGLAVVAFVPAQQAYISDQAPDHKRGRTMGVVEFSWSSSAIITLPIVGWMIEAYGWRAPLLLVSLLSFIGAVLVWRYLPPTAGRRAQTAFTWQKIVAIFMKRNVMASVGVALLLFTAVVSFATLWGIWLVKDFGLAATTIGLVGTGIGAAELAGAGLASLFIDRMGKRRGSGMALLFSAIGMLLLPFTLDALPVVIVMLFVLSVALEFTIVSLLPLYAEQLPEAPATVLSLVFFGVSIGSAAGVPVTTTLWEWVGLWGICVADAVFLLTAFVLMQQFLVEMQD